MTEAEGMILAGIKLLLQTQQAPRNPDEMAAYFQSLDRQVHEWYVQMAKLHDRDPVSS